MYPQTYFLVSLLVGVILAKFGLLSLSQAVAAAAMAVLIDLDYFIAALRLGVAAAWRASREHEDDGFFHSMVGFIAISAVQAVIALWSKQWALVISVAYWSHLFLDTVYALLAEAKGDAVNFSVKTKVVEMVVGVFSLLMAVLYLKFI